MKQKEQSLVMGAVVKQRGNIFTQQRVGTDSLNGFCIHINILRVEEPNKTCSAGQAKLFCVDSKTMGKSAADSESE